MTTCRVCSEPFDKDRMGQVVCGLACAKKLPVVARNTIKAEKRETRKKLDALKPRGHWLRQAQVAFNAWIRARDAEFGCISCGTFTGKMNAGHYRSVGSCPELRFEPLNVAKQCERCNTYLHGNLIGYREALRAWKGDGAVEWLEGPHEAKKYSADDLKAMAAQYRALARAIQKASQ